MERAIRNIGMRRKTAVEAVLDIEALAHRALELRPTSPAEEKELRRLRRVKAHARHICAALERIGDLDAA
ncbi:MAG: hypothetical protein EPO21_13020 [Chloroflexota bacterium]|nr:MAG: hypothetical protein EPO21_13020 [Chloroflexota bacterium]